MELNFKRWPAVVLRGLGQVAFADTAGAGVLVLAAIAAVSPWAAFGAAIGAVTGTAAGRFQDSLPEPEWEAGLSVPNPAIVGILWGSAFSVDQAGIGLLVLVLLGCVGLEQILRPLMRKARLPMLSAPAVAIGYIIDAVYSVFGDSFWRLPQDPPFGNASIGLAVLLVLAAALTKSRTAATQAGILAVAAGLISGWVFETGALGPAGLWAFTVAPATFGVHAVFLAGAAVGGWAGLFAAVLGAAIWGLWVASPLSAVAPPLLTPFILATWATIGIVVRAKGTTILEPELWRVATEIRRAHLRRKSVVALTGAGISTASGIPDYVSGGWLQPGIPVSVYSMGRFLTSPRCRREYWDACNRFRDAVRKARPNPAHRALAEMERSGWLSATITQNVDALHQDAGARSVVELHGRITHINCLSCGWVGEWPPDGVWRHYDLHCQSCSGLLKPAVIAMGEQIPPAAWESAKRAVDGCGVMIVVGSQIAVSSAHNLLSAARQGGAKVVVVSIGRLAQEPAPDDIVLENKAENLLPALAELMDCPIRRGSGRAAS
jgi:NAD-dependent SIR2 family protein deacetylase